MVATDEKENRLFPIPTALLGIPLFAPHSAIVFQCLEAVAQHPDDRACTLANVSFSGMLLAEENEDLKRALTKTDYLFPTGFLARVAAFVLGLVTRDREEIRTIVKKLLHRLETEQKTVFFVGQLPPGSTAAKDRLSEQRTKLKTVGEYWISSDSWSPKEGYQLNKILRDVRPDVLFFSTTHSEARIWMTDNAPSLVNSLVYDLGLNTALFERLLGFKRKGAHFTWLLKLKQLFGEPDGIDRHCLKRIGAFVLRILGQRKTLLKSQTKGKSTPQQNGFTQEEREGIIYVPLPAQFDTDYLIRHRNDWARLATISSGVILNASEVLKFDAQAFGTLLHLTHQFQHRGYHLVVQDPSVGLVRFLQYSNTPGQLHTRYNQSAAEDLAKTPAWSTDLAFGAVGEPILWRGNITSQTADQVWEDTTATIRRSEQRTQSFQIDLSKVTLLDSTGIGTMIKLKKRFTKQGYRIAFVNPKPNVKKLLEMTQLSEFLLKG